MLQTSMRAWALASSRSYLSAGKAIGILRQSHDRRHTLIEIWFNSLQRYFGITMLGEGSVEYADTSRSARPGSLHARR